MCIRTLPTSEGKHEMRKQNSFSIQGEVVLIFGGDTKTELPRILRFRVTINDQPVGRKKKKLQRKNESIGVRFIGARS